MIGESFGAQFEELCHAYGIDQALVIFRDGSMLSILTIASNPVDEAAVKETLALVQEAILKGKDRINAAVILADKALKNTERN